jgi:catechol 2,3-dioxygenase-like lactoylglutathione lyase family enzyme
MLTAAKVVATIPVTDLEQAREFYGGTLGLAQLAETPVAIQYGCGAGSELSVFKRPPTVHDHTVAHFEVADLQAAVEDLSSSGVEFVDYTDGPLRTEHHIAHVGPFRGAWFLDPDGNTLGLREL